MLLTYLILIHAKNLQARQERFQHAAQSSYRSAYMPRPFFRSSLKNACTDLLISVICTLLQGVLFCSCKSCSSGASLDCPVPEPSSP